MVDWLEGMIASTAVKSRYKTGHGQMWLDGSVDNWSINQQSLDGFLHVILEGCSEREREKERETHSWPILVNIFLKTGKKSLYHRLSLSQQGNTSAKYI